MREDSARREAARELHAELEARGLLEFGAVVPSETVRAILGLVYPKTATKRVYDELSLRELSAVDYIRGILLNEGKYLTGTPSGYRVLLPSENARQVELYMNAADKKLQRARKLHRNTPTQKPSNKPDQTDARILMKREAIRRHFTQPA